jgi:hypothetical protein
MTILVIILIIIAIPFVVALFLDQEYVIEKDIAINRTPQEVFGYIKLLKNAGTYNKWVMQDPNLKKEFRGTDGAVGFVYGWDSDMKNVGKGEQEITHIKEGQQIDYVIRFVKPFQGTSYAFLKTAPLPGGQSKVTWIFKGIRNYPMRIFHFLLNLKKVLGRDLQESLVNLKTVLEKN